jgi:hypothetical protein
MTLKRPTMKPVRAGAQPDLTARVGVVLYDTSIDVDAILAAAVLEITVRGIAVAGLLQSFGARLDNGKRSMWIEDIRTGTAIRLDSPRGRGAVACMLDPDALARAACLLKRAIESRADLVLVNRFGNAEADGRGMRAEFADAICAGAAVLVAVRYSLLNDLEGFLGGPAYLLLPSPLAIADWAEALVARRPAAFLRT